jgi:CRISPR-associated endonuclease/helicase Cas3
MAQLVDAEKAFESLFSRATKTVAPLPYQKRLALADPLPTLLDVPTGLGKTAAAVLAWIWRRRFAAPEVRQATPRRLIYCLPMRVLVEQTYRVTNEWLNRLALLTEENKEQHPEWSKPDCDFGDHPISVHLLLGGEEKSDWALWPERDAILIGTQDMLLSRAMNRGYAAGRARWPLEFGLLNSDCLWVFDEIQIMDTGLASSLQLDAWRRSLRLRPARNRFPEAKRAHTSRPCHSLWMSATMARHWLERAVDWSSHVEAAWTNRHQLEDSERTDTSLRSGQLFQIKKPIVRAPISALEKPKTKDGRADKADAERKQTDYLNRLAEHIGRAENHAQDGLTLVIVNTVDRARKLYELLSKQEGLQDVPLKLIHSRFRPFERAQWESFLNQKEQTRRILISTQVVEAGVDLSASILYTELAPWASLVQRFGRCARYPGDSGNIIWLDLDLGTDKQPVDHWALPYDRAELIAAREKLLSATDGGLESLTKIKQDIEGESSPQQATTLFPYEPRFVPHDKDLFDLFDTTPDLTGADVDISRFIRDGEELDVQVFWREVHSSATPLKKDRPHRRELCPVPFHRFRELLPALRKAGRIWRRNYRRGWELIDQRDSEQVYPGQVFLLEKACGGYDRYLGWTGDPKNAVEPVTVEVIDNKADASTDTDESEDLSELSKWFTIEEHTRDVCKKLDTLLADSGLSDSEKKVLRLAGRLHDWGKSHVAFQAKLKRDMLEEARSSALQGQHAAKAPDGKDRQTKQVEESKNAWRRDKIRSQPSDTPEADRDRRRPGFRHELASALAILQALYRAKPDHTAFAWPDGLNKADFGEVPNEAPVPGLANDPLMKELITLNADELDLLIYLVAAHHGKVRMSLRSSPDDDRDDVPDPCSSGKRQARGVRDGDEVPACKIPDGETPTVTLSLDPMELGLSARYGASWRERTQLLLERLGPFQLGYLEALLRAADCRASAEEDERGREGV